MNFKLDKKALLQEPDAMEKWFESKRQGFEALPED